MSWRTPINYNHNFKLDFSKKILKFMRSNLEVARGDIKIGLLKIILSPQVILYGDNMIIVLSNY